MIKVLFVAHSGSMSGGANRSLLSLIGMLREKYDILPHVLTPANDDALFKECERMNIPVSMHPYHSCCTVFQRVPRDLLRIAKLFAAPVLDWMDTARISKQLPDDFDLVYTNDRMVIMGAFLAKHRKLPHIWHVRAFGREVGTIFPFFWEKAMARLSQRIVAISRSMLTSLKPKIPDCKLRLIHNGLQADQYLPFPRAPHQGFHLLLTGHMVPHKGQMEALHALDLLVNQYHVDAQLSFAGKLPAYGNTKYLSSLKEFIHSRALEERVHFLGQVSNMNELRSQMDVELECCWCEPFGRVTVEAMLSGLPVVGAASGGTLDIIEGGVTGLLYRLHHPEDLAKKLFWLSSHPQQALEIAQRGREHALNTFTLEHTAENVYALISEVMAEERHAKKIAS